MQPSKNEKSCRRFISVLSSRDIRKITEGEHPQAIVAILYMTSPIIAKEVLETLSESIKNNIILRLSSTNNIPEHAFDTFSKRIPGWKKRIKGNECFDGREFVANILHTRDGQSKKSISENLAEYDDVLVGDINERLFHLSN